MSSKIASNGSSNRTPSFSSLSSFSSDSSRSSFREESPVFSPESPPPSSRIPFSWEKLPGIPKKQLSKKVDTSSNILPLPPAGNQFPHRKSSSEEVLIKKYDGESFRKDPFFAALVECSKDHDSKDQYDPKCGKIWKITRSFNEGFTLMCISSSCKNNNCVASDTMFISPRSRKHSIVLGRSNRGSKATTHLRSVLY